MSFLVFSRYHSASLQKKKAAKHRRYTLIEKLESRLMMTVDWRNPTDGVDVDGDSFINAMDALYVINDLNANGSRLLPQNKPVGSKYLDCQGDGYASAIDALVVINHLNSFGSGRRTIRSQGIFDSWQDLRITVGGPSFGARIYRVEIDAQFDNSTATRLMPDLMSVYLVDPNNASSTLLDRGQPGTSLFSLSASGAIEKANGLVSWDGRILELDLSQV
ncbi:MAG: putative deoxyribonuclease RhsC, partial [Planctomycetota bacterium]